ncbi:MAG: protein kinase domain-containing protein [Flavisolibacter sp.]
MARVFTITEGLENMGALKTGGQGSVYKGRRRGEIITAVKLLPTPIHTEDPNDKSYRDFQNEVNKLRQVNQEPNPNVVKMLNFGITESGSFPFIEMEFIEGPDLEELLQPPHDSLFTVKEAIKVAEHLSHALAHCHRNDVKHGDMKSNNVKYNRHTGNYILLDFGLAALSDEQRRTSLRHAGAVEFMAPEQSDGELLFQSDIYGFGIILFEILAGVVPFPMDDRSESARNRVMLAHRESPPPDLLALRSQNMPEEWSDAKKRRESMVPEWMTAMVYKCLQKRPENRFLNGSDLYEFIVTNSTQSGDGGAGSEALRKLKQQNRELLKENEKLQKAVLKIQGDAKKKDEEMERLKLLVNGNSNTYSSYYPQKKKRSGSGWLAAFLTLVILGSISYFILKDKPAETKQAQTEQPQAEQKPVIARYRVGTDRAYFYNSPEETTPRSAWVSLGTYIDALDDKSGSIYTEFTNSRGQVTKGWLRKQDLLTPEEFDRQRQQQSQPPEVLYRDELKQAENFLVTFQVNEALRIYRPLVDKQVPEAMYQYGNLALKDQNHDIGCAEAMTLIGNAADKGYVPAKTTLGYLYIFAENPAVLQTGGYTRCSFNKNVDRGVQLLEEASTGGDAAAKDLLAQYRQMQGM